MINTWIELEDFTKDLLNQDHPIKPALSGGTKEEEDVIGETIIAQCKYTSKKNMSILKKDLARLLDACKLHKKFPLFITSNSKDIVLSIPITQENKELIDLIIRLIIIDGQLKLQNRNIDMSRTLNHLDSINAQRKTIERIFNSVYWNIKNKVDKFKIHLETKFGNISMYNLFEQGEQ